jgi:hypothetical protein
MWIRYGQSSYQSKRWCQVGKADQFGFYLVPQLCCGMTIGNRQFFTNQALSIGGFSFIGWQNQPYDEDFRSFQLV